MSKGISIPQVVEMFRSGLRGTATSEVTNVQDNNAIILQLVVTAQAGTNPTLDLVVQDAPTATGPWSTLNTFIQVTAATANVVAQPTRAPMPFIRAVGTVGGTATPTFTYQLNAVLFKAAAVSVSSSQGGVGAFSTLSFTSGTGSSLAVTGGLTSSGPAGAGIGYATGAGGAVTQATNRTTGVTLSTLTGAITTNNASLAAEAAAEFTVTNTTVAVGDTIIVTQRSGSNGGNTKVFVSTVAAGSFKITVANDNAAGGTAETGAIIINYAVVKAVSA